jgi:two-component system chemotaxis response regulator CheB
MSIQRMLICEDSSVYAAALRRVLEYDGDIVVAAVCASAEEAIAALPRIRPDLVTMDLELPGMDGLTAVEQIMNSGPVPILVLSGLVGAGSATAAAAMAAGAVDAMAKGDLDLVDPASAVSVAFRRRVRVLCRARVIRHLGALLKGRPHVPAHQASVVGICSSTGGPQVLAGLLEALQHISAGFTEGLAHWLGEAVPLPVGIATDGAPLKPGIWIAPDGAHLKLTVTGHLALDRQTLTGHHRPSADVLLASIAEAAGAGGVAVVLTGMGSDGALGAAAVRRAGGLAIAQDEASSAVYGMPRAAIEGGTDIVLPPNGIAARLLGLNHRPLIGH